ncbi:MAG: hypothetical protein MHMPM18_004556 [Marteilia pararefringens]
MWFIDRPTATESKLGIFLMLIICISFANSSRSKRILCGVKGEHRYRGPSLSNKYKELCEVMWQRRISNYRDRNYRPWFTVTISKKRLELFELTRKCDLHIFGCYIVSDRYYGRIFNRF